MQIEKKLILCSILAVAIGVAAIIPLQYLMNAETAAAIPNVEPWFDVNVEYAYCNPYQSGGNGTASWNGAFIQAVANFTLTADAMEADADAQVEYYNFAVSSEQGPICDMGYYIVEDKVGVARGLSGDGTITFANGLTYRGPNSSGGQGLGWSGGSPPDSVYGAPSTGISAYNGEELPQAVTQIRNAQSLSIDVSKVCTVTVKGNITVTTPADPTILQHIELTKTDTGFIYGNYVDGRLPYPIIGPQTTQTTPTKIFNVTTTLP